MGNDHQPQRPLPVQVWHAFWALVVGSIVLGSLYGAGMLSGTGLIVALLCILLAFVPWAVLQLDPRELKETYKNDQQK